MPSHEIREFFVLLWKSDSVSAVRNSINAFNMAATAPVDMTLLPDEKYEIAVSYGTIIGTGVFAIVVCSTKLYIRKFMLNSFGIDDWACLIGLVKASHVSLRSLRF